MRVVREGELQLLEEGSREEEKREGRARVEEARQAWQLARKGFRQEEIDQAEEIVALFAANPGAGTLGWRGAMVDRPHLVQAQQLLATAAKLATR